MKKFMLLLIVTLLCNAGFTQIKVNSLGNVGLGSSNADPYYKVLVKGDLYVESLSTSDWGRAIWAKVNNNLACSYNLYNNVIGKDVFYVCAEGWLWTLRGGFFGSDIKFKQNIMPIENSLNKVLRLNGIRFKHKTENEADLENKESDFRLGFIAQEVEMVFPEVVKDMPDGTKAMSYTDLIAALVEAIKEQQKLIDNLQQESNQEKVLLKQEIEILRETLNKCCIKSNQKSMAIEYDTNIEQNSTVSTSNNTEEMKVYQNSPNPFNEITTIQCYIPQSINTVQLCVYDMTGTLLKNISVIDRGNINVQIQADQLTSGIYIYMLIGDGKTSEAKQMIITH